MYAIRSYYENHLRTDHGPGQRLQGGLIRTGPARTGPAGRRSEQRRHRGLDLLGRHAGPKAGDHPTLPVDQELGEIPLNAGTEQAALFFLEPAEQWRGALSVYVDLRELLEGHPETA